MPSGDCRVVHSGQQVLGMENVRSAKFTSMGPWETSVNPSFYGSTETNISFWFCSGCRKKRLLVREIFIFPSRQNLLCSSAPKSSKKSVPCRKLDSRRHWQFSTAILGRTKRRNCADCSHPS